MDLAETLEVSGFLPFKKVESSSKHAVGAVIDVTVDKMAVDGRTCVLDGAHKLFISSLVGCRVL